MSEDYIGSQIGWLGGRLTRPSVLYRPTLARDGNKWCALYGPNLAEGVCGFGDTPELAMEDFDRNWRTQRIVASATEPVVVEPEPTADPDQQAREAWLSACQGMTREADSHVKGDGWRWYGGFTFVSTRVPMFVRSDGVVELGELLSAPLCDGRGVWTIPPDHPVRLEAERVVAAVNARHDLLERKSAEENEAARQRKREQVEAALAAASAKLTGVTP